MSTSTHQSHPRRSKRGQVSLAVVGVVILAVLAIVVSAIVRMRADAADELSVADTARVRKGAFEITIPVSGELAALRQIEIRNKVDGRAVINEIIAEGTNVKAGDIILKLNDDEIRDEWRQTKEEVNAANAAYVTAMAELTNVKNERDAELAKADAAIKLADLALKAWASGEDPSKRQELTLALESAEKDYARLQERYAESAKLLERKFLSKDEFKQDEISMIKARSEQAQAKLDLDAYVNFQSLHDKAEKESDLEQATLDRNRIEDKFAADVQSADIEVVSAKFELESEQEDLKRLDEQLAFCTVTAPSDGLVVYFSSLQSGGMGRNEGRPPVVGTELTRNEPVMILPDTSQMVASVKVSEARSGTIRPGQRATIISDANPGLSLMGEVLSVGVLAESGGWRDPNRRDYTVKIMLKDGYELGLKPAMRCTAEIYVGRVSDALHIPIQSIFRNGPMNYVYVPQGSGYAQKQVVIGRSSELFIEIKEGLSENQTVLLREPATEEIVYRLPAPKQEEKELMADIGEAPEALPPGMNGMRNGGQRGMQNGPGGGMPGTFNQGSRDGGGAGSGGAGGERPRGGRGEGPANAGGNQDNSDNPQRGENPGGRRRGPPRGDGNNDGGGSGGNDESPRGGRPDSSGSGGSPRPGVATGDAGTSAGSPAPAPQKND